jgi:hypothetical protein
MKNGFEKLQEIGAQKIHEQTHIVKQQIQALLHESFDDMTKIQFLGFVSILERDYHVDLSDLRAKGLDFFAQQAQSAYKTKVFVSPSKKRNFSLLYIFMALSIFIFAVVYTFSNPTASAKVPQELNNETIALVQENILEPEVDINQTEVSISETTETSENNETPEATIVEEVAMPSLIIMPRSKLWIGYIDLVTHRKYQKTTEEPLVMDTKKDWLLFLGHGSVRIDVNGDIQNFNEANNLRFLYKEGILKTITFSEFKELNKGEKW